MTSLVKSADLASRDRELGELFRPRSLAVVGASPDPMNQGTMWLEVLRHFQFAGPVYPVNPRFQEVLGQRCYPGLRDIPGPVDYVISCVPAALVPGLVEDCIAKGVKLLHLYTGRLAESAQEDRIALQAQIGERARGAGLRIIGPNCMGLYHPAWGISFKLNFPREPGAVGFLSQSGGNAEELVYKASLRGVRFSQAISYGNALDIDEGDLLEHFLRDPETRVIAGYIEGVRDGPRLVRLLKGAAREKPVLILKGGRSQAGTRAVASHTGSLAGSDVIWTALFRQTGAVQAHDLDDLCDLMAAFYHLAPALGRRVAVMGGGGGNSVQGADACELAGLEVPPLSPHLREEIKRISPDTWFMMRNPVDGSVVGNREALPQIMKLVAAWEGVDLLIGVVGDWPLDQPKGREFFLKSLDDLLEVRRVAPQKPMAVVVGSADATEEWRWRAIMEAQEHCTRAGIPTYPNLHRAARALACFIAYHEDRAAWNEAGLK